MQTFYEIGLGPKQEPSSPPTPEALPEVTERKRRDSTFIHMGTNESSSQPRPSVTKRFLEMELGRLRYLTKVANASAHYYTRLYNYFFIPSMIFLSISGLLNLVFPVWLAAESLASANAIAGIFAWISGLLLSIARGLGYGPMGELFQGAAEQLEDLTTKVEFEIYDHNDPQFISKLENKILEIQKRCKYRAPPHIQEKYT